MDARRHHGRRHHHGHHRRWMLLQSLSFASIVVSLVSSIMGSSQLATAAMLPSLRRASSSLNAAPLLHPSPTSFVQGCGGGGGGGGARAGAFLLARHNTRNTRRVGSNTKPHISFRCLTSGYNYPTKSGPVLALNSLSDSAARDLGIQDNATNKKEENAKTKKHYHCYLLRSTDPDHSLKTYIGFTTDPRRRLRQHNGEIANGARRTKRGGGRPWTYVAVIDGFEDKVAAMQFEWAWQHVGRSRVFREAVGCDKLARKMKRRRGVRARLDELGILLSDCPKFSALPLEVYFPDAEDYDLFRDVSEQKIDGMAMRVCPVDEMPFAQRGLDAREVPEVPKVANPVSGSPPAHLKSSASRSWLKGIYGASHFADLIRARNSFSGLMSRPKTSWALNAVADASVQDSQSSVEVKEEVKVPAKFKPYPFQYHTELIVRIESLTNLGFGIARVELEESADEDVSEGKATDTVDNENEPASKWVVFVPNVIPGELVRVKIYRNYASYSDADLMQIIEPSPDRIEPRCALATICGGCQYQHITIDRQREMKTMQVQELFERLGGFQTHDFPKVLDTIGTDEVFEYRSKITPHYDAPMKKKRRRKSPGNDDTTMNKSCEIGPIGFKEKASRRLVDVPHCHIATSAINDVLSQIRETKREEARQGLLKKPTKGATLLLRDSDGVVETDHNVYVNTTVKDMVFRFQAGNFFQNNPFMLPKMVDLVVEAATKKSPSGKTMTHLIDCYCGSGLFALGSSSSFDVCVGIEVNEKAVDEAQANAALNGIKNCDFVSASAEAIFQSKDPVRVGRSDGDGNDDHEELLSVGDFPRESTVVVVDPPRKGCSEEFLDQLNAYQPARVVYMSCGPDTQARDAKCIVGFGYEIVSIQPFDLFPQTRHIECLAVFEKVAMT